MEEQMQALQATTIELRASVEERDFQLAQLNQDLLEATMRMKVCCCCVCACVLLEALPGLYGYDIPGVQCACVVHLKISDTATHWLYASARASTEGFSGQRVQRCAATHARSDYLHLV